MKLTVKVSSVMMMMMMMMMIMATTPTTTTTTTTTKDDADDNDDIDGNDDDLYLYSAVTLLCYCSMLGVLGREVSFKACCQWALL